MRTARSKVVTGNQVIRTYGQAVKRILKDPTMAAIRRSAGFVIPPGQELGKEKGFQIFVSVVMYDAELLVKDKSTGGLLTNP